MAAHAAPRLSRHDSGKVCPQRRRAMCTREPILVLEACQRVWRGRDDRTLASMCPEDIIDFNSRNNIFCKRAPAASIQPASASQMFSFFNVILSDFQLALADESEVNVSVLDTIICRHFRRIPFHDWVDASFGYRSDAVDALLMSISVLRAQLQNADATMTAHVQRAIKRSSRFLHPLTLGVIGAQGSSDLPIEMLENFLNPIRVTLDLGDRQRAFLRLMMLSVRFEDIYLKETNVDWSQRLSEDFTFCEALKYDDLEELARLVTLADIDSFSQSNMTDLCNDELMPCDRRWTWLSHQAYECATVSSALINCIYRLANGLYRRGNYHSMTALVAGVKRSLDSQDQDNICASDYELQGYAPFIEPTNDYEYCRAQSTKEQVLPWLRPFRRRLLTAQAANHRSEVVSCSANLLLQIMNYTDRVRDSKDGDTFDEGLDQTIGAQSGHEPRVVVLGDSGVGKSSWIAELVDEYNGGNGSPTDLPTIEHTSWFTAYTNVGRVDATILDCGGADIFPSMVPRWAAEGNVLVLVYNAASRASFDGVSAIAVALSSHESRPTLLLACNSGALTSEQAVPATEAATLARRRGWLFAETRADDAEESRQCLYQLIGTAVSGVLPSPTDSAVAWPQRSSSHSLSRKFGSIRTLRSSDTSDA